MLLEVQGLVSGYGKVTVLHGVTFNVAAGEIVVVLGPNGAGKSTLMKTIAGHLTPTSGTVTLEGADITGLPAGDAARRGVGYVPQEQNVFRELTVRDNLRVAGLRFAGMQDRLDAVFTRFPFLAERANQRAATLSGGERQTLAVSSALVGDPRVLLLDEPSAGLAPLFIKRMVTWVQELADTGMGVAWVVEQNPDMVLAASTRTYLVEGGRVTDTFVSKELLKPGRLNELLLEERKEVSGDTPVADNKKPEGGEQT